MHVEPHHHSVFCGHQQFLRGGCGRLALLFYSCGFLGGLSWYGHFAVTCQRLYALCYRPDLLQVCVQPRYDEVFPLLRFLTEPMYRFLCAQYSCRCALHRLCDSSSPSLPLRLSPTLAHDNLMVNNGLLARCSQFHVICKILSHVRTTQGLLICARAPSGSSRVIDPPALELETVPQ